MIAVTLLLLSCASSGKTLDSQQGKRKSGKAEAGTGKAGERPDTSGITVKDVLSDIPTADTSGGLSEGDALIILACNNYLQIFPKTQKSCDVLQIKASTYYNAKKTGPARKAYKELFEKFPESHYVSEAVKMIAQSYYEEKNFTMSEEWYRKLKDIAGVSGSDKEEAVVKLSESIYRTAEGYEKAKDYHKAAKEYERVSTEFPNTKIADVALLNAGLLYEKLSEWSNAILVYSRLIRQFKTSQYVPRSYFRTGKCHEKLSHWNDAANTYITLVKSYPRDPLSQDAIYNAGFCFENAENWSAAAKVFEKMAELYPKSKDASNVLFRAAELYMKINDWENVSRINKLFEKRYGNDQERIVQVLCMAGVAAKMQKKIPQAVKKFEQAVETYHGLRVKNDLNKYYAAKSCFTLGEIYHDRTTEIKLKQPKQVYTRLLEEKTTMLEKSIKRFTAATKFQISEWTTRSIFMIAKSFEDFARDIFEQQRPKKQSIQNQLALESGISSAVVEYLIKQALPYYEKNVNLGIKMKVENKWILQSREKLTALPYFAANSYAKLISLVHSTEGRGNKTRSIAQIGKKLQILQQIAPFQSEAINLYLKTTEMGVKYQIQDEFVKKATGEVTAISYNIGETFREIVDIAKSAPIPRSLTEYEQFLYKIKLVQSGIVEYENNALNAYYKNLQIAKAYNLQDQWVDSTRMRIGQILFSRAYSFDILAVQGLDYPPFPEGAIEEEIDVYRAQFEELGFKLQDQALEIYKDIMAKGKNGIIQGPYLKHTYMRLYQLEPRTYGKRVDKEVVKLLKAGPGWKCSEKPPQSDDWKQAGFDDKEWHNVLKGSIADPKTISGFGDKVPPPMWGGNRGSQFTTAYGKEMQYTPAEKVYFRNNFKLKKVPLDAKMKITAVDSFALFINGKMVKQDSSLLASPAEKAKVFDVRNLLISGENIIAVEAASKGAKGYGLFFVMKMTKVTDDFVAAPPGEDNTLTREEAKKHVFPVITNFERKTKNEKKE